jgi:hypothetical protein
MNMKVITRVLLAAFIVILLDGFQELSNAAVTLHDPTWEAPGEYSQAGSGNTIQPGGYTWDYSDFDSTAYDELYYVIGDYDYDEGPPEVWTFNPAGPRIGTKYTPMSTLTYNSSSSDLSGGKVVWDNTININIYQGGSYQPTPCNAYFTLLVTDGSDNPLPLVAASTITGMDPNVGGAYQITGDDFRANWLFELQGGGVSRYPAGQWWSYAQTSQYDELRTSVTRAFYYSAIPIPGALWLFASGLIGLGVYRRKFKT